MRAAYLGLEIVGVVVGVLRVHWLLLQSLAHVAEILSTEAGNGDTGVASFQVASNGIEAAGEAVRFLSLPSAPLCR